MLNQHGLKTCVIDTSFVYESPPLNGSNQPRYINVAASIETFLDPPDLLNLCKDIERKLGRREDDNKIRWSAREIDLDILFYENLNSSFTNQGRYLKIPHEGIKDRDFVLYPLNDLDSSFNHPVYNTSIAHMLQVYNKSNKSSSSAVKVLPVGRDRVLPLGKKTYIQGILNLTPDSFSDGAAYSTSTDNIIYRALEMEEEGADIIDVGGESTRPMAVPVSEEEELGRIIHVIQNLRKVLKHETVISVDTYKSSVARIAIKEGADIINDISAGTRDENMLKTARLYY